MAGILMSAYGKELILDMNACPPYKFTRENIRRFMEELCEEIGMTPHDLHFWDDEGVHWTERQTDPKTKGTSAVQFLMESNITVHCLDLLGKVFINVFSCKGFDSRVVCGCAISYFGGTVVNRVEVTRQ